MSDKSLLLVAHGSRVIEANEEVRQLARLLQQRAGNEFLSVRYAFLELGEPDIGESIDNCVSDGAQQIIIYPYFLAAGRHVIADIPQIVTEKQAQYPKVDIDLRPYLGTCDALPGLILDQVKR